MNDRFKLNAELVRAYLASGDRKQSHLVKELNLSGSMVARMLGKECRVPESQETLEKLARLMGVAVNELLIPRDDRRSA